MGPAKKLHCTLRTRRGYLKLKCSKVRKLGHPHASVGMGTNSGGPK